VHVSFGVHKASSETFKNVIILAKVPLVLLVELTLQVISVSLVV
jgi:hypothetical protein